MFTSGYADSATYTS